MGVVLRAARRRLKLFFKKSPKNNFLKKF